MVRLTRKRLIVTAVVLFLLTGGVLITWELCDWPPARLILKYGFPPAGGPTGRRMTIEGIEFIELSSGYFRMGSHRRCTRGDLLEVEHGFWIAKTEVTAEQYAAFRPRRMAPAKLRSTAQPVAAGQYDATEFCEWLTGRAEGEVRLPFETEWEFACQAGSAPRSSREVDASMICSQAWCNYEVPESMPVATKDPNNWGIHDMLGNVWEWCHEEMTFFPGKVRPNEPKWAPFRGGGWKTPKGYCRATTRNGSVRGAVREDRGFRPVMIRHADSP